MLVDITHRSSTGQIRLVPLQTDLRYCRYIRYNELRPLEFYMSYQALSRGVWKMTCDCAKVTVSSPIGPIKITSCNIGIHEINLPASDTEPNETDGSVVLMLDVKNNNEPPLPIQKCIEWLQIFFQDASQTNKIPLPPLHTTNLKPDSFVSKVLLTLTADVPAGQVISYGQLAAKAGNAKAARAAGLAMRTNPIPLLYPCHRVIKSDGTMGNYMSGRGVGVKEWLLKHEGASLKGQ